MNTITIIRDEHSITLMRQRLSLNVAEGPDKGKRWSGSASELIVGKGVGAEFKLSDPAVSRHHLRIEATESAYVVSDLDSRNGTWMDGVRVHQIAIRNPIRLAVGSSVIEIAPQPEQEQVTLPPSGSFGDLLGESPPMLELFGQLHKIAPQPINVLIEGETGTGKELIARAIHQHSARKDGPFVVLDCSALPFNLVGSELFGHKKGAFTGADQPRQGAFEAADGGTLFLDEIGELDVELQPQLLRAAESGDIKRIGENSYRKCDVRIVAATNRDLRREVNQGYFRADLFYRLAIGSVRVPPLRQRKEDIPLLVRHMVDQLQQRFGGSLTPPTDEQLQKLTNYAWPGNVRELRNRIEALMVTGALELSASSALGVPGDPAPPLDQLAQYSFKQAKATWVEHFERDYIGRLLQAHDYNVAEVSRQCGLGRAHILRLARKHGLRDS